MEKSEIIYLASKFFDKGWDFEESKYGDDLYGREAHADEIWQYVVECKQIGSDNFREKYKEFKLY